MATTHVLSLGVLRRASAMLVGLLLPALQDLSAQPFTNNININGLDVGRYGGSLGGDSNPFTLFHNDATSARDLTIYGNDSKTFHLRLYDGDLKMGEPATPTSTFYNNGSLFLGGSVGTRLTIGGEGKLNFRLGRWVSLSETGGGFATVIGNNVQSSVSSNNYMQYIDTSADGARAIKLQYDQGITFHTVSTSTTAGAEMINSERMRIDNGGRVGIGISSLNHKLEVNGTIRSKEVIVEATSWPDYVFGEGYALPPLETIEAYVKSHRHLPEVPSSGDVENDGVKLGEMNAILLKKIEELTLYVIDLKKQNDQAMDEINKLKASGNR
jgi:hypothetical protein